MNSHKISINGQAKRIMGMVPAIRDGIRVDSDIDLGVSGDAAFDCVIESCNVVTSKGEAHHLAHYPVIDLDIPATLVPSSTPGHSHLYIDHPVPEAAYFRLLDAMAECGIVQKGYAKASRRRGYSAARLPWVKKPDDEAIPPNPNNDALTFRTWDEPQF